MQKITISKRWKLQLPDFVKAALYAAVIPVGVAIQQYLDSMAKGIQSELNWKLLAMTAVATFVFKIFQSLVANPYVKITTKTNDAAEEIEKQTLKKI